MGDYGYYNSDTGKYTKVYNNYGYYDYTNLEYRESDYGTEGGLIGAGIFVLVLIIFIYKWCIKKANDEVNESEEEHDIEEVVEEVCESGGEEIAFNQPANIYVIPDK